MQPDSDVAPKRIMINDVLRAVMQGHGLSREDIFSENKTKALVRSRNIGFYICRTLTSRSYEVIGYYFGGKDHSTVIHGIKKIETSKRQDRDLCLEIDKIALSAITIAAARELSDSKACGLAP